MKNLLLASLLTVSATSSYAGLAIECVGKGADKAVSMSVLEMGSKRISDGDEQDVAVRIEETVKSKKGYKQQKTLFAGMIRGSMEDVQFFLSSQDEEETIHGTIYMDEMYDMSITLNGREINMNCEGEGSEE